MKRSPVFLVFLSATIAPAFNLPAEAQAIPAATVADVDDDGPSMILERARLYARRHGDVFQRRCLFQSRKELLCQLQ